MHHRISWKVLSVALVAAAGGCATNDSDGDGDGKADQPGERIANDVIVTVSTGGFACSGDACDLRVDQILLRERSGDVAYCAKAGANAEQTWVTEGEVTAGDAVYLSFARGREHTPQGFDVCDAESWEETVPLFEWGARFDELLSSGAARVDEIGDLVIRIACDVDTMTCEPAKAP